MRKTVSAHDAITVMLDKPPTPPEGEPKRNKVTAFVTLTAHDAISEIQRDHRRKTGRKRPLWHILDAAVIAYAQKLGIKSRGE